MTTAPVNLPASPPPARPLDSFDELTAAHRRALLAHCYRMLGSIDDAEDAVQEAFARAWRARETYRQDISARAWLYRIATNVCLDAIERRHLTPGAAVAAKPTIAPVPAELFADVSAEPHARYDAHESVSMAFLAALQLLTPTQRAVLILRDVLGWRAAEVAPLLGISLAAANSSLHRARLAMAETRAEPPAIRPSTGIRALLDRYVRAWESADIPGLVALLREDAVVSMPPGVTVAGAASIGRFLEDVVFADERRIRMQPVDTTGGPGYLIESASRDHPELEPYAVVLLGLDEEGPAVTSMTVFAEPRVVARFALG